MSNNIIYDNIIPAQDALLYPYNYYRITGGSAGCNININGVEVGIAPSSNLDLNIRTLSGGTGCYLSGNLQEGYGRNTFVSTWDTRNIKTGSSNDKQIKLPLVSNGSYKFRVEWGDGTSNVITTWNQIETTHTYNDGGIYQIKITGLCKGFDFSVGNETLKIVDISQWGIGFGLIGGGGTFKDCSNLVLSNLKDILDLTDVTTFINFFSSCNSLTTIGRINDWDTSNITNLNSAFRDCNNFNDDLNNWDTSNITNLYNTFSISSDLISGKFNGNISTWDTSKVIEMNSMLQNQINFNQDINTKEVTVGGKTYIAWDTLNVITMSGVFRSSTGNATMSFNRPIGNWNTSKVTSLSSFCQQNPKFNQDINTKEVTVGGKTYIAWDTLNVTLVTNIFYNLSEDGEFNQPIGNWNTSKMTTLIRIFHGQLKFNQDINTKEVTVGGKTYIAWDTLNVTTMESMFNAGKSYKVGCFNGNISNWNTSKVTSLRLLMQYQEKFNQNINTKEVTVGGKTYIAWDTLKVTNIEGLFYIKNFGPFNQPINNWNTSKVTSMRSFIGNQYLYNQEMNTKEVTVGGKTYIAWDTLNVTSMDFMFVSTNDKGYSFNQDISGWNTSKVTSMDGMFHNSNSFNQDISDWDISKVTTFGGDLIYGFMEFKNSENYSVENYDKLLSKWSLQTVIPNLTIKFGDIKHSISGATGKNKLTSAPNNWVIIDGGQI